MKQYVTTDSTGRITACSPWPFPGASLCPCEVVRYTDGSLYRTDNLPPVYAVPGTADQQIGGKCPDGGVMMSGPRPEDVRDVSGVVTETWVASQQGSWEKKSVPHLHAYVKSVTAALKKAHGLSNATAISSQAARPRHSRKANIRHGSSTVRP